MHLYITCEAGEIGPRLLHACCNKNMERRRSEGALEEEENWVHSRGRTGGNKEREEWSEGSL